MNTNTMSTMVIEKTKNVRVCEGRKLTEWVVTVNGQVAAKLGKWGQAKEYLVVRTAKFTMFSKWGACAEVATSVQQFIERLSQELASGAIEANHNAMGIKF